MNNLWLSAIVDLIFIFLPMILGIICCLIIFVVELLYKIYKWILAALGKLREVYKEWMQS